MSGPAYSVTLSILVSTAIGLRKYRIPSDLRSQAEYRLVSTKVGDHLGILGVVVFAFCCAVMMLYGECGLVNLCSGQGSGGLVMRWGIGGTEDGCEEDR